MNTSLEGALARTRAREPEPVNQAEQLRKALEHLAADHDADVCKLYGVSPEEVRREIRRRRTA